MERSGEWRARRTVAPGNETSDRGGDSPKIEGSKPGLLAKDSTLDIQ
jgi:hypothetical protein